jgi:hypothetical protein
MIEDPRYLTCAEVAALYSSGRIDCYDHQPPVSVR